MARDQTVGRVKDLNSSLVLGALLLFPVWYFFLGLVLESREPAIPYFVSEYMVTFAGGFVRRGIMGQTFWTAGDLSHLPPMMLIKGFRVVVAVAYVGALVNLLWKQRGTLGVQGIALVLSSPLISIYIWFALGSIELLFPLITLLNVWISQRGPDKYLFSATLLFGTVGLLLTLCHEAFLFLCLPINVMLSWRTLRTHKLPQIALIYLAPMLGVVAATIFHGSRSLATKVIDAWSSIGVSLPPWNAIKPLASGMQGELRYVGELATPPHVLLWFASSAISVAPLAYLGFQLRRTMDAQQRIEFNLLLRDGLGIPLLCTIPLYVIGTDWHRWIALPFACGIPYILAMMPCKVSFPKPFLNIPVTLLLVLVSLIVAPTGLYYPVQSAIGGPLTVSYHAVKGVILHKPSAR